MMPLLRPHGLTLGALAVAALALAACEGGATAKTKGPEPSVVASTQAWALVAKAVAGDRARVASIVGPGKDPHDFDLSAKDSLALAKADIVVANGADYDPYVGKALAGARGPVVVSADRAEIADHSLEPQDVDRSGLANGHLFFNFAVVDAVAAGLAEDLSKAAPQDKDVFQQNLAAFHQQLKGFADALGGLAKRRPALKAVQTESVGHYLLGYAGAADTTPRGYRDAVAKGVDPSLADQVEVTNLLKDKGADFLLYNNQDVNQSVNAIIAAAKDGDVPVVAIGETPTAQEDTYRAWLQGIVQSFVTGLGGRPHS